MISHAHTIHTLANLHHHDLLGTAADERRAATAAGPASRWRPLTLRAPALAVLAHGSWRARHAARKCTATGVRGRAGRREGARRAENAHAAAT